MKKKDIAVVVLLIFSIAFVVVAQQVAIKDGSTQVTATVTADGIEVQQGGTWTVQPGNTANTTAWLVTGTGGTFPATMRATGSNGVATLSMADLSASVSLAAATTTEIIPLAASESIYVTGYGLTISTTGATAQTVQFVYGTGTNCATGATVITGAMTGATLMSSSGVNAPVVITQGGALGAIFQPVPASNALCLKTTGTQGVGWYVSYTQY